MHTLKTSKATLRAILLIAAERVACELDENCCVAIHDAALATAPDVPHQRPWHDALHVFTDFYEADARHYHQFNELLFPESYWFGDFETERESRVLGLLLLRETLKTSAAVTEFSIP